MIGPPARRQWPWLRTSWAGSPRLGCTTQQPIDRRPQHRQGLLNVTYVVRGQYVASRSMQPRGSSAQRPGCGNCTAMDVAYSRGRPSGLAAVGRFGTSASSTRRTHRNILHRRHEGENGLRVPSSLCMPTMQHHRRPSARERPAETCGKRHQQWSIACIQDWCRGHT